MGERRTLGTDLFKGEIQGRKYVSIQTKGNLLPQTIISYYELGEPKMSVASLGFDFNVYTGNIPGEGPTYNLKRIPVITFEAIVSTLGSEETRRETFDLAQHFHDRRLEDFLEENTNHEQTKPKLTKTANSED
jgi:hypothetical protein